MKIRVSTHCESGLESGIITAEMKNTQTQETVARINSALAARGLDPLDEEQAYFLANPTIDPEQTEGVLEDLHRMGVEVSR